MTSVPGPEPERLRHQHEAGGAGGQRDRVARPGDTTGLLFQTSHNGTDGHDSGFPPCLHHGENVFQ
jgi:hypothetical protein